MVRMSPGTGVRSHILRANDEVASALGELAELMAIAGGDSFRAGTALEINAFPDRLDLNDELARAAQDLGMVFSIATDAHSVRHLDNIRYGVATDLGRRRRASATSLGARALHDPTEGGSAAALHEMAAAAGVRLRLDRAA